MHCAVCTAYGTLRSRIVCKRTASQTIYFTGCRARFSWFPILASGSKLPSYCVASTYDQKMVTSDTFGQRWTFTGDIVNYYVTACTDDVTEMGRVPQYFLSSYPYYSASIKLLRCILNLFSNGIWRPEHLGCRYCVVAVRTFNLRPVWRPAL